MVLPLLKHSREGIKALAKLRVKLELVSPSHFKPQQIMKSISTSLGILFGFAIFVNVVATPGPTSEDDRLLDGCPATPIN